MLHSRARQYAHEWIGVWIAISFRKTCSQLAHSSASYCLWLLWLGKLNSSAYLCVCGCVLAYTYRTLNCTQLFVMCVYSVFLKNSAQQSLMCFLPVWGTKRKSWQLKGNTTARAYDEPLSSLLTGKLLTKAKNLCVSLPSCEVQEYPEWRDRYGGAPVSCLYRAGGELHTAKVIPASHFALHLVFIFQAIKPAARRWSVCMR